MATAPPGYNYAAAFGIHSLAAAVIFAILYFPLFGLYVSKAIARPTYVFIILSFFCAIRITAFILRALLAHVPADGQNLDMLIAYEIIYNTGFFGLLYSAYTLVADRVACAKNPPNGPISRILRMRFLFRLALMAAVAIGITGAIDYSLGTTTKTINTGNTLRKVAIYIFLVCAALVLLQTLFLARAEMADGGYGNSSGQIGSTHGVFVLMAISLLLLAREAFFTATADKPNQQNNEAIWYPLSALLELIAVMLFATPGLVPARSEIPTESSWA
ncbi:hypothetical protein HYDPIDRAFT_79393 [Hydnomerulius pinastri MD-312]|nr:hypothetical protein HYDPIDRAFT_79393 [Hydnomerulius pinastri MD-312]